MKQKLLFEIVGGNQFKLISENINGMSRESLVKEGLRKVFMNAGNKVSYKYLQNVGLGYIKDVTEARKCAIQEARILAKEYGFEDNENTGQFVRETENDFSKMSAENPEHRAAQVQPNEMPDEHPETDMNNPEEKREVQIGNEILSALDNMNVQSTSGGLADDIRKLAQELIDMHSGEAAVKPGTGGALYKKGSIY